MSAQADQSRLSTVAGIMSRPVLTVPMSATLADAWQLLLVSGLRHLVVLNANGSTVGVLSDRNVLAEVSATTEHLGFPSSLSAPAKALIWRANGSTRTIAPQAQS